MPSEHRRRKKQTQIPPSPEIPPSCRECGSGRSLTKYARAGVVTTLCSICVEEAATGNVNSLAKPPSIPALPPAAAVSPSPYPTTTPTTCSASAQFSSASLAHLFTDATEETHQPGQVLLVEGERDTTVSLIIGDTNNQQASGSVIVSIGGVQVGTVSESDPWPVVGELSGLFGLPASATVVAGPTGVRLLVLRRSDALVRLHDDPEYAVRLAQALCRRIVSVALARRLSTAVGPTANLLTTESASASRRSTFQSTFHLMASDTVAHRVAASTSTGRPPRSVSGTIFVSQRCLAFASRSSSFTGGLARKWWYGDVGRGGGGMVVGEGNTLVPGPGEKPLRLDSAEALADLVDAIRAQAGDTCAVDDTLLDRPARKRAGLLMPADGGAPPQALSPTSLVDEVLFTPSEWSALLRGWGGESKRYKEGEVIVAAGAVVDALYYVRGGVVREEDDGETVSTVEPGACFAELNYLAGGGGATTSFVADTPTVILDAIPHTALQALTASGGRQHFRLLWSLGAALRQKLVAAEAAVLRGAQLRPTACVYFRVRLVGGVNRDRDESYVWRMVPRYTLGIFVRWLQNEYLPREQASSSSRNRASSSSASSTKPTIVVHPDPSTLPSPPTSDVHVHVYSVTLLSAWSTDKEERFTFGTDVGGGGGDDEGDVSSVRKRRVVYHVSARRRGGGGANAAFRRRHNRLAVKREETTWLGPATCAAESLEARTAALEDELAFDPPRLNALHQLIQGSVVPMVNAGPTAIAQTFLGPSVADDPVAADALGLTVQTRARLAQALQHFVTVCGRAVAASAAASAEHGTKFVKFQSMVEEQLALRQAELLPLLEAERERAANNITFVSGGGGGDDGRRCALCGAVGGSVSRVQVRSRTKVLCSVCVEETASLVL